MQMGVHYMLDAPNLSIQAVLSENATSNVGGVLELPDLSAGFGHCISKVTYQQVRSADVVTTGRAFTAV